MRGRTWAAAVASLALGLMVVCPIVAQPGNAPAAESKKKEPDIVHVKADITHSAWGDTNKTLLKGHVEMTHGDTILTSDLVDCDNTKGVKTAVSPGKINITNPECDIVGDKGTAYFLKKLGVVEGDVILTVKPKVTEQERANADKDDVRMQYKERTVITCKKLDYLYKQKLATMTGGIVFTQKKRKASSDSAVYDQAKEILTLDGNVKGLDEQGQTFSAPGKVIISLKEGDEWIEAPNATATFKVDLDEDENPPPAKKK